MQQLSKYLLLGRGSPNSFDLWSFHVTIRAIMLRSGTSILCLNKFNISFPIATPNWTLVMGSLRMTALLSWYAALKCSTALQYTPCNCIAFLFPSLPWPGDREGTFRSLSQAATYPPVYHTRWRLHTVSLIAERQAGKLWIPIFIVFGLIQPVIESEYPFSSRPSIHPITERLINVSNLFADKKSNTVKRYCSSVLLKKWEPLDVRKRCRKPFSTVILIRRNMIHSIWLRAIGIPAFRIFVVSQNAYYRSLGVHNRTC